MGGCTSCFEPTKKQDKIQMESLASAEARQKAADAAQQRAEEFKHSAAGRAAHAQIAAQAKKPPNPNRGEPVLKWQMG